MFIISLSWLLGCIKLTRIVWLSWVVGVSYNIQIEESKHSNDVYEVSLLETMVCQAAKGVEHLLSYVSHKIQ